MRTSIERTLQDGRQVHENYTDEDHLVWRLLFDRQMEQLKKVASAAYLQGLEDIGFTNKQVPNYEDVNKILGEKTGWSVKPVKGIVDDAEFFDMLANKIFPATTWLRSLSELDYLEEPDMFHDVFGHLPLLTNKAFTDFLEELGNVGLQCKDENEVHLLSRFYWFTVEFGLIKEGKDLKVYGAGLLSSAGETSFSLSEKPARHLFDLKKVIDTSYRKDQFQTQYFVVNSFDQLYLAIKESMNLIRI
ncbi:MAG: phenylalanine 4-monooxygenase [Candidatus Cyclobacteriaceae bacterium M2_1C_046]